MSASTPAFSRVRQSEGGRVLDRGGASERNVVVYGDVMLEQAESGYGRVSGSPVCAPTVAINIE